MKRHPVCLMVLAGLLVFAALPGVLRAGDAGTEIATSRAARVVEPLVKPVWTPLPPGAVEPSGWLRDWAMAAKNGITGHLDEWHPTFGDGWKGVPIKAPGAEPDGAGWPIEQCSYWLDGLVRLGYVLHDDILIQKAEARLGPIVDGVNRGGTSLIYWKQGKPSGFNSWAHSQMGRALVAWYQATGEKRILDALVKAYADYPVPMGHLDFTNVSGLCNVDAALETYAFSGDRRVLDRVLAAIRSPAAQNSMLQWRDGQFLPGHAVITYEDIRVPALLYPWTDDPRYLQASLTAFAWVEREHMLPYGLASGEEYMSGIGAFRKTETCNVAAGMWSMLWMYRILGERGYGDAIERAFFNAGAAPSRGTSRPCATTSRPTASVRTVCLANNPIVRGRGRSVSIASAAPTCCAASAPSTASSPITSCTCGWPPPTEVWQRRSTGRARFPPSPAMACR